MTTLILGYGGMIGCALRNRLVQTGEPVICVSRTGAGESTNGFIHVQADRAKPETILSIIRAHGVDRVVDVVAYTEAGTQPLLDSIDGDIERYVLISSCDVYRQYEWLQRLEGGTSTSDPLDETAPLRTCLHPYRKPEPRAAEDPEKWMDDYDKIPIENAVQEMASDWTILRLPMVYGPGDRQRRFRWAIEPLLAGEDRITLPENWLNWTTTYGYVENVAAAIAHVLIHPRAARQVYNLTDEPAAPNSVWFHRFAEALDWHGALTATEDGDHPMAKALSGLDLTIPLAISGDKLHHDLGFTRPVSLEAAIRATIASERALMNQT